MPNEKNSLVEDIEENSLVKCPHCHVWVPDSISFDELGICEFCKKVLEDVCFRD